MADFGAFQVETPQEVLARSQERLRIALGSNNPVQQQTAMFDAVIKQMIGDPQLEKAEATQEGLQNAAAGVRDTFKARRSRGDSASALDEQIATLRAQRDALMHNGQADAAAQATQALTLLGIKREEEARLQNRERRDQALTAQTLRGQTLANDWKEIEGKMQFFEQPDGEFIGINVQDADAAERLKEQRAKGLFGITNAQRFQLEKEQRAALVRAEHRNLPPKVIVQRIEQSANNLRGVMRSSIQMAKFLNENPDALSLTAGASAAGNKAFNEYTAATERFLPEFRVQSNARVADAFFRDQEIAARAQGQIKALAYVLARKRGGGGVLTEQDFKNARDMIAASSRNPGIVMNALSDQIGPDLAVLRDRIKFNVDGVQEQFGPTLANLEDLSSQFHEQVDRANQIQQRRRDRGETALEARDNTAPGVTPPEDQPTSGVKIKLLGIDP